MMLAEDRSAGVNENSAMMNALLPLRPFARTPGPQNGAPGRGRAQRPDATRAAASVSQYRD